MKLSIIREDLLVSLQQVIGAIERRQTLPTLNHFLFRGNSHGFSITATDLEIELLISSNFEFQAEGDTTIPAQKLLDICRLMPEQAQIDISSDSGKVKIVSGNSRFTLGALPVEDFPAVTDMEADKEISLPEGQLRTLIERTAFSMAQQDVRYYLNGLLLEVDTQQIKAVATDGHRLALSQINCEAGLDDKKQIILPRKGVQELQRLLAYEDRQVKILLGKNHFQASISDLQLTSKLVEGQFPEYQRVLPPEEGNRVKIKRALLRQALMRVSILSNDKNKGVRLILKNDALLIQAHNMEHEEAEEELRVDYKGEELEVGFNVIYLLDILNALESDDVEIFIKDAKSSTLLLPVISSEDKPKNVCDSRYVIMPMRL